MAKDINHRVSKRMVDTARGLNAGIKLEKPDGIRGNKSIQRVLITASVRGRSTSYRSSLNIRPNRRAFP